MRRAVVVLRRRLIQRRRRRGCTRLLRRVRTRAFPVQTSPNLKLGLKHTEIELQVFKTRKSRLSKSSSLEEEEDRIDNAHPDTHLLQR